MKFLLHTNSLTERGDSVDLLSMGKNLKHYLQIDSVIAFPYAAKNNEARVLEFQKLGLEIFRYKSREDLENFVQEHEISHNYVYSDGTKNGISYVSSENLNPVLGSTIHITRAVFRNLEPIGDYYLYCSKWLFDWTSSKRRFKKIIKESNTVFDWLPFMVEPEPGNGDEFRYRYKIPRNAKLLGRIGGFDQFSDPAARNAVLEMLEEKPDFYFIAVNTQNFGNHPHLIYIPYLSRREVWDFYSACDLLLNGRLMGESFGYSIVEPLSTGKPVLGPGRYRNPLMDKHHLKILGPINLLYNTKLHLKRKLNELLDVAPSSEIMKSSVENFTSEKVMQRFKSIVLES